MPLQTLKGSVRLPATQMIMILREATGYFLRDVMRRSPPPPSSPETSGAAGSAEASPSNWTH